MNNALARLHQRAAQRPEATFGIGASEEVIASAESELEAKLPDDYRDFLRTFGWYEDSHLSINGLGEDCPDVLGLLRTTQWERNESALPLPPHLVPLSNDGAGNLYCLWVTEGPIRGRVVFVETHRDQPETYEPAFQSFQDFLSDALSGHRS